MDNKNIIIIKFCGKEIECSTVPISSIINKNLLTIKPNVYIPPHKRVKTIFPQK